MHCFNFKQKIEGLFILIFFFFFFFSLTQRPLLLTSLEYTNWCQNHPTQFQLHLNPFKQLQGPLKAGSRVPFPQASVSSQKSSPHAGLSGRVWSELNLVKEEFSLPQPPVGIHKSTSPPFPAPPKWAWEQPSISTASDSRKGDCEGMTTYIPLRKSSLCINSSRGLRIQRIPWDAVWISICL